MPTDRGPRSPRPATHTMTLDRLACPALLIVDMQNDFVRVGAPLEVPQSRDTIPVHRRLLEFCRTWRVPVLYTKFVAGPRRTLIWEWSPVLAPPVCCWKGHRRYYEDVDRELDCSDIIDEIYPVPDDPVIEKFGYGAFHNTNLIHAHPVPSSAPSAWTVGAPEGTACVRSSAPLNPRSHPPRSRRTGRRGLGDYIISRVGERPRPTVDGRRGTRARDGRQGRNRRLPSRARRSH